METIIDTVGMTGVITAGVFVGLVWIVTIILFLIRPRPTPRPLHVQVDPIRALDQEENDDAYYIQSPGSRGPMFVAAVLEDEHTPLGASVRRMSSHRKQRRSRKSKRV